jgi:hypothetical protein
MTLLQTIGSKMLAFFKDVNKVVIKADAIAQDIEPLVAIGLPAIAPLFNLTVSAIATAETTGQAALGSATGGGPQKLATVIAAIEPQFVQYMASLGLKNPTSAQVTAWINGIVAAFNGIQL